ncbi:MAG: IclR family transcriptional regulator [Acidimicrobiales bacterium]
MSSVQSVERAFSILDALASGPMKVTMLATQVGLPKSTVSRLLSTMQSLGVVDHDRESGDYLIGPAIYALASAGMADATAMAVAQPYLVDLAATAGEATGLSVLDGDEVLFLTDNASRSEIQIRDWSGERTPAHLVPSGLVMIAAWPDERIEALLAKPLVAATERSVVDPAKVRARIEAIRDRGYEFVRGEFVDDVSSVAAPVLNAAGETVAAIHIHGPSFRFLASDTDPVIAELVETAARISRQLGSTAV